MEPNSIDVARAVMALADAHGLRLNLTQLQKLLYIVYGTCLAILGHPPFRNEPPRAWPFWTRVPDSATGAFRCRGRLGRSSSP